MTLSTSFYSIIKYDIFFQLYFAKDRSIMLKKTKEFGYKAIVFTADAPQLGTRERDERNNFKMPDHLSLGLDYFRKGS